MKEKQNLMSKGINGVTAMGFLWTSLTKEEKERASFATLVEYWTKAPVASIERSEIWALLEIKAEYFSHYKWLWGEMPLYGSERSELWRVLKKKS